MKRHSINSQNLQLPLNHLDIKTAFRTTKTIKQILKNTSKNVNSLSDEGVYKIRYLDCYRSCGSQTYSIKLKRSFSKQQSCLYYDMDAPHERLLGVLRESLTAIVQEFCELFWTNPWGYIPPNNSCTTTNLPSKKPSKKTNKTYGTLLEM